MINRINNCRNRNITGSFNTIEEVISFIKSPPQQHLELVQKARGLDRKSQEYNNIKVNQLPAISVNFNFSNGYIMGRNVHKPTGYLYIDVDGMTEKDFEINTAYICAYWRSLSNTGVTLVVKVDGLTQYNFKEATEEIATTLDIPYDRHAISIDRLTVLSYDPNAYYNGNTEVIPVSESEYIQSNSTIGKSTHYNNILSKTIGYDYSGYKLRFNNLDELIQQYDIVFDENGLHDFGCENKLEYSLVFVPFRKIFEGERENVLKSIAYQLIALNKTVNKGLIMKYLYAINYSKMSPPLENSEVEITVAKIYQNLNQVKPIPNRKRRFIYDMFRNFTPSDKKRLNIKKIHQDRINKTKSELWDVMVDWDSNFYGKMTINKIAKASGKNKKTVQKYYNGLKSMLPLKESQTVFLITRKKRVLNQSIEKKPLLRDLDDLMRSDLNT
ncbi:BT4734/BF3469 family protein [Chryseobacterium sp. MA9]|uniref:BT4734/BF3469 family protein n=1 Tax=Chryseobacterium sp. MA9 TaxID=2966625 RepID=UPI002104C65E|nr:BT4734/BF3469 family protein [Chryseobacterium sp. MA9]UTX46671.1 hypothetical protein KIK00_11920 [Chryseobacterium sp. MA9]